MTAKIRRGDLTAETKLNERIKIAFKKEMPATRNQRTTFCSAMTKQHVVGT